jgi:hypothetical protein
LSRVSKPPGVWGRVHEGKGKGWNFCTLAKPLPSAGGQGYVRGISGVCIGTKIFVNITFITQKGISPAKIFFLA